jgi:peptidoglycan/xylan/chitin deacetylase (PgdA/CDA1 family)
LVKGTLAVAGGLFPKRRLSSRILTYHSVGLRDHEMNVRPDEFRRQMEWLVAHVPVISLREAADLHPGVAVTFDDGYRDNLTEAAPVLRELGIPATVFLVVGRLGGLLDHDAGREHAALLTWDDVGELQAMGIEVGAHGLTHRRLSVLSETEQREEIGGSKRVLEHKLGKAVEAFAYPFGSTADYTALSAALVREYGYAYAVSNRYGANHPGADRGTPACLRWALRRICIDATDTLENFGAKVEGALDLLAALDSPVGLRARRALNRWLGVE